MTIEEVRRKHRLREEELLRQYRRLLDVQRHAIEERDLDHVERTIHREREIIKDLEALSTVNLPASKNSAGGQDAPGPTREQYDELRGVHQENRRLLADLSERTARELSELKIPRGRKTVYTSNKTSGSMIDLQG